MFFQQTDPSALSVRVKQLCPQPDKYRFPSRTDLHTVRILRMPVIRFGHQDVMVPHRDMPVSLPAADFVRFEPDDPDRMDTERNEPEKPEPERRDSAFFPDIRGFTNRLKRGVRSGDILKRLKLKKP